MDRRKLLVGLFATALGAAARPAWADVKIKITAPVPPLPPPVVVAPAPPQVVVTPPAPPPVVVAPPQVVVVPGSSVYYAPGANFNMFVYGGRYYSFHNGVWFRASRHRGPWKVIEVHAVPRQVRGVPVRYYRVPPGHAKKMGGHPGHPDRRWDDDRGRGHKGKRDRD